jgi:hypothetical protein
MGTDDIGLPAEASRGEDVRYHIIKSLNVAPPSVTKKILTACLPFLPALWKNGTVLISPVPRYLHSKCCKNDGHIENFSDPVTEEEIAMGLEGLKRLLCNWAVENKLSFELLDPIMLNDAWTLA